MTSPEDNPDPQRLLKSARQMMSSAERRKKFRRIDFLDSTFWYPTQLKFFAAGSTPKPAPAVEADRSSKIVLKFLMASTDTKVIQ